LLSHRLRATGCQIEFVEQPAALTIAGDAGRLGQVLLNLCSNAIDAYEDAGILGGRIEVAAHRKADMVTLTVRDRAGGIPTEILPRIFDELFTTKGPGRGTGLGLWIARNLTERDFGGTLRVESSPGQGSCFIATLPANSPAPRAPSAAGRPSASSQTTVPPAGKGAQVLTIR